MTLTVRINEPLLVEMIYNFTCMGVFKDMLYVIF